MANHPPLLTSEFLATQAKPGETAIVRVLYRGAHNTRPYTIQGKKKRYWLKYSPKHNCHILDVPASVWMDGMPTGAIKENPSICYDIMSSSRQFGLPLILAFFAEPPAEKDEVPVEDLVPAASPRLSEVGREAVSLVRDMVTKSDGPDFMQEAFDVLLSDAPDQDAIATLQAILAEVETPEGGPDEIDPDVPSNPPTVLMSPEEPPITPQAETPKRKPPMTPAERVAKSRAKKRAAKSAAKKAATFSPV